MLQCLFSDCRRTGTEATEYRKVIYHFGELDTHMHDQNKMDVFKMQVKLSLPVSCNATCRRLENKTCDCLTQEQA